MAETTPTTRLEAVNQMLRAIGESPVSSLAGDVGVDVVTAKETLSEITKAVLLEGWQFNTEHDYPLNRDVDNEIVLPANAATVDVTKDRFRMTDPVVRGTKLYDRANHTYTFETDVTARIIFLLPFEELPESARYYITYRACRKFQDNSVGAAELHRFNSQDELKARIAFEDDQAEDADLNLLKDTPGLAELWRL